MKLYSVGSSNNLQILCERAIGVRLAWQFGIATSNHVGEIKQSVFDRPVR